MRKLALALWMLAVLTLACRTDVPRAMDAGVDTHKLGSMPWPSYAGDFLVQPTAATPFAIKDTGGITRDTFETAHGRVTFGGGGSDTKATLGPYVGNETTLSALYLLTNAQTTASGPVLYSDGASLYAIPISSSGEFRVSPGGTAAFDVSGNVLQAAFGGITGGTSPLFVDWSTATTPFIHSGTSATSLRMGTNSVGATFSLQADAAANVMQFAGGTQNGVALGSNMATAGHIRLPSGFQILARNGGNTGNNILMSDDGAANLNIGGGTFGITLQGVSYVQAQSGGFANFVLSGTSNTFGSTVSNTSIVGSAQFTTRTTSANVTIDATTTDNFVFVDTSAGVVSVTLPTPTNGRWLTIIDQKNTFGTNACTLVRHATEKIDNVAASKTLNANGYRGNLISNGTDWYSMNVSGTKPATLSGALLALGLLIARRRRAHNDNEVLKEAA